MAIIATTIYQCSINLAWNINLSLIWIKILNYKLFTLIKKSVKHSQSKAI